MAFIRSNEADELVAWMAAYLDSRKGLLRTNPTIVCVTRQYVTVSRRNI